MKTVIKKKSHLIIALIALFFVVALSFYACASSNPSSYNDKGEKTGISHYDGYKLEQTTVLSRHNIRSPLTGTDSVLAKITPHQWFNWTSDSSELSLLGGELETLNGQYFSKYMQAEGLIPNNWQPKDDECYFYANSYQRTIATAKYFNAGFLPISSVGVYHKNDLNVQDPTFLPILPTTSDATKAKIKQEIKDKYNLESVNENLKDNYKTLEYVLDFKDSEYAKEKNIQSFDLDVPNINVPNNDENTLSGTLKDANSAADALTLQYYEVPNDKDAAFGHDMSFAQWEQIGEIVDVYEKILFGTHTAAIYAAHPMLQELLKDMNDTNRKFTFLCGHDSTLYSVLTALGIKDYTLPNAITKITPIGSKVVFNKYVDQKGEEYCSISMVYQTVDQLRHKESLDMNHPPQEYKLELEGLQKNNDGLYKLSDVVGRFNQAIAEYNN